MLATIKMRERKLNMYKNCKLWHLIILVYNRMCTFCILFLYEACIGSKHVAFFSMARQPLGGIGRFIFRGFTITLRHPTLGRTPLDE